MTDKEIREAVRNRYSEAAKEGSSCCSNAESSCCSAREVEAAVGKRRPAEEIGRAIGYSRVQIFYALPIFSIGKCWQLLARSTPHSIR